MLCRGLQQEQAVGMQNWFCSKRRGAFVWDGDMGVYPNV